VEALNLKLYALMKMFEGLQPEQKREAGVTANVMLSLIDRVKGDVSSLPMRYSQMEANAYNFHGWIAINEGTEESARRAEAYIEKSIKVCEAISEDQGIVFAKSNIADAKSKYVGGNNNEELLKTYRELFELRVAKFGEENEYTIIFGKNYADILQKSDRREEARELLTKLLATSKQVLGPDHKTTEEVKK
jgi:tetratricopeptide (TPR) repeat protein